MPVCIEEGSRLVDNLGGWVGRVRTPRTSISIKGEDSIPRRWAIDVAKDVVWLSVVLYIIRTLAFCSMYSIVSRVGLGSRVASSTSRGLGLGHTAPKGSRHLLEFDLNLNLPGYNGCARVTMWRNIQFRKNTIERGEGSTRYGEQYPW